MATVGAIIVGAGRGERMGGLDKVFTLLADRPVLTYSLATFEASRLVHYIVLVLHERNLARGQALMQADPARWRKVVAVVAGGERRQDSVRAGLVALPPCDYVIVHDAARPLVTTEIIRRGVETAQVTGA
ncbi:MAG: IspD/TarI family cytidylyltransferase, partial [Thermomicrobiales bacterium]